VKKDQTSGSTYDTLYWYGAGSNVVMETDLTGNLLDEYVFFNGQRMARRRASDGAIFYFFSDHLGSNRIVTNATGGVVEDSDFYPFGGERVVTDTLNNNYKFTGHERDGESGLDYFVARHYAFTLGRFLQPDLPFADQRPGNPQTWNLYAYARNNPLYFVDPSGRAGCPWNPCTGTNSQGAAAGRWDVMNSDPYVFGCRTDYEECQGQGDVFVRINFTVPLLDRTIDVTVEGLFGSHEEAAQIAAAVRGSVEIINNANLSPSEQRTIHSITGIYVNPNIETTHTDTALRRKSGDVVLKTRRVMASPGDVKLGRAWFASVIAHEARHIEILRQNNGILRGYAFDRSMQWNDQNAAFRFQQQVGRKLQLTQTEMNRIEAYRTATYIQIWMGGR
jgi:RHS repeat-associated protein